MEKGMKPINILIKSLNSIVLLLCLIPVTGCISGGSTSSRQIETLIFFYQPPDDSGEKQLPFSIAIDRFSGAQILRTGAMIYIPAPYKIDEYLYHRWRMPPGEMVSEFLRRDFRSSGRFQAVFGPGELAPVTHRLAGRVEECQELDHNGIPSAVLSLQATLFEEGGRGKDRRIVFQKIYRRVEPMAKQSPDAMAESLSRAMKVLSGQIEKDIVGLIKERQLTTNRKELIES